MNPNFNIEGKVIIVTGGYGVLGGSVASGLASAGARILILGRNQQNIDKKVEAIRELGGSASGYVCDVLDKELLVNVRQEILVDNGQIDALINAAGGNIPGSTQRDDQSVFDLAIEDIDKAIDLNMRGTLYPTLVFGKSIAETGGSIINISSMATYDAISRVLGYTIGKTGVNQLTKWTASEFARKFGDRIRVNAVAPGFFIGDQNRKLLLNEDGSLTERSKKVLAKTPMGRFGEIHELNGIVQFLCSDQASFITGVIIPVDGGFSAFSGV